MDQADSVWKEFFPNLRLELSFLFSLSLLQESNLKRSVAKVVEKQHTDLDDNSELSFGMVPSSSDMFSLAQTGPSGDHLGSPWVSTEGQQHMTDFHGHGQTLEAEDYSLAYGAPTPPHGAGLEFFEDYRNKCASPRPESGKRLSCGSPEISSKRRNTKTTVSKTQTRIAPAPTSTGVSSMGLTGNALAFQSGSSQLLGVGQSLYQDLDHADPLPSQAYYHQDPSMGLDVASMQFSDLNMHVDPSHMQFNPDASPHSPWTAGFTPPQSPHEDEWYPASLGSSSGSPESPPSDYGVPQPFLGQDMGMPGLAGSELSSVAMTRDNSYAVSQATRRPRSEGETARDHALYKNAAPQADGLFHCPWEGTAECHHRPEKLKCNYDKFVDSHLRPYRCKVESCADARFSSTACLLRHEREAHRMHGHQAYNCTYKGCERSQDGKGFPRAWNLKDHMRRVHNDHGNGSAQAQAEEQQSKGRRKSKGSTASSRKSSKSMPVADSSAMERVNQDYMDWDENYVSLQSVVQQLGKPTDPESRRQLKKARRYLDQMSDVYLRVNPGLSRRHSGD